MKITKMVKEHSITKFENSIWHKGSIGHRLLKSKKGEDMLVDFWAILIFALILIVFLILFIANKHQTTNNIDSDFYNKDSAFMLDSFLRAPYLQGEGENMAEIISQDILKNDFTRTESAFNYFFTNIGTYNGYDINYISLCLKRSGSEIKHFNKPVGPTIATYVGTSFNVCPETIDDEYLYSKTTIPGIDRSNIDVYLSIRHTTKNTYSMAMQLQD